MRRLRAATSGLVGLLATLACGKQTPPTVEPEPAPVVEHTGPRPGEVDNEYIGHTSTEGDPAPESDTEAEPEPDASEPEAEGLTTQKLHALAEDAFDAVLDPYAGRIVTPALPAEWPPTSGKVVMLAYPLTPAATGVVKYICAQAAVQVTVTVADGTVQTEKLATKGKALGTFELPRIRADDPIFDAEQALLDVVAGKRTPRKVHYLLERYKEWLDKHGKVGDDIDARHPAFVKFARDPL